MDLSYKKPMVDRDKTLKSQKERNSTIDIKQIQTMNLYDNSLGLKFLYDFLGKKSDLFGILLFSLFWVIVFSISTFIEGTFVMQGENTIGWSIDFVWFGVIIAIVLLFYLSKKLFDKFILLFSNEILRSINNNNLEEKKYCNIVYDSINFIKNKTPQSKIFLNIIRLLGLLGILIYGGYYQIVDLPPVDVWHHATHLLGYSVWLIYNIIILGLLGPILIWRYIAIMISIDKIVKQVDREHGFNIIPMSPDNVGGLSNLGRFGLYTAYIPTIPLLVLAIWVFVRETSSALFLGSALILGVFVGIAFIIPLYSIHKLLKSAKENELIRISDEFNKYYQIVVNNIDKKGPTFNDETNDAVNNMEKLRIMFESCEKMGIWPVNTKILVQLGAMVLIPILITILPMVL